MARRARLRRARCRRLGRRVRHGRGDLGQAGRDLARRARPGGRIGVEQALEQRRCLRRGPDLAGHDEPRVRAARGQQEQQQDAEAVQVVRGVAGAVRRAHQRAAVGPHRDAAGPQLALCGARLVHGRERERELGAEVESAARRPRRGRQRLRRRAGRTSRAGPGRSRPTRPAPRSRRAARGPRTARQAASSAGPDRLCAAAGAAGPSSTRPFIA